MNSIGKNRMVVISLFAIFCWQGIYAQRPMAKTTGGKVLLSGKLIHFTNQVVIEDMSEFQYLLPAPNERIIIPDTAGNFRIQFELASPGYFRVGRNILYLAPGDNLKVNIDYNNSALASFAGKGEMANHYLTETPFPKAGSFIEAGSNIKSTPALTIDTVLKIADSRRKKLKALTGISNEFRRLENARIQADIINSISNGVEYSLMKLKIKDSLAEAFRKEYWIVGQPVMDSYLNNFSDASLMQLVVYRDIDDELIKKNESPAVTKQLEDWELASSLVNKMRKVKSKQDLAALKDKINEIKTLAYKDAAEKMYEVFSAFGKGDTAIDFTALSADGKDIELSRLKGKIIYVDLWATWCGPCLQEMPHFETLKEKYRNNPDIAFVSLSIDDNKNAWHKSLDSRSANGYQWQINRESLKAYSIVSVPRTLLIDKDFKMIDMDGALPSDDNLISKIDELLKK